MISPVIGMLKSETTSLEVSLASTSGRQLVILRLRPFTNSHVPLLLSIQKQARFNCSWCDQILPLAHPYNTRPSYSMLSPRALRLLLNGDYGWQQSLL